MYIVYTAHKVHPKKIGVAQIKIAGDQPLVILLYLVPTDKMSLESTPIIQCTNLI